MVKFVCRYMYIFFSFLTTSPKTQFPTCPVYQNMKFPHISYTYLAEDRAEFHENEQNVLKTLPYPTNFQNAQNSNICLVYSMVRSSIECNWDESLTNIILTTLSFLQCAWHTCLVFITMSHMNNNHDHNWSWELSWHNWTVPEISQVIWIST